ncbi:MAG: M67 family metallopeptidase [Vicinamibacterales bacterium]
MRHFAAITLPSHVSDALVRHARQSAPFECCGLLIGDESAIVDLYHVQNIASEPRRMYTVDPDAYFHAIREARSRGLQVIGAYHSHPGSLAVPSPTDREHAFSGFLFVIVGLADDPPTVLGWELIAGNFAAVPLVKTA